MSNIIYTGTRTHAPTADRGYWQEEQDFETKEEAIAYVDAVGSGNVITWAEYHNLPGCLPEMRRSSCALDACNDGVWKGINIHG
jgi:hypothetical protein